MSSRAAISLGKDWRIGSEQDSELISIQFWEQAEGATLMFLLQRMLSR
jgi:hypothetical protein